MRLFKRALSAVLAAAMCFPTGISGVAFAAENDEPQQLYTVTLGDAENGEIRFPDSDETSMDVSEGETVEVLLVPEDGYVTEGLWLTDTDTGETLAEKQTTDNVFSFPMPSSNLTVGAGFTAFEDISPDADGNTDGETTEDIGDTAEDGTAYEVVDDESDDFPATDENTDTEDIGASGDGSGRTADTTRTTAYIAGNLDEGVLVETEAASIDAYSTETESTIVQAETDRAGLAPTYHTILVNYNLADASAVKLAAAEFSPDELISSVAQMQQIYALDDNADCFVAFIDPGKLNGAGEGVTATFSNSDVENAVSYTEYIRYDADTGIAYIPKSLFYNEDGEEIVLDLQAQVYVPYVMEEQNRNVINVTVENNGSAVKEVSPSQRIAVPSFDVTVTIPLTTPETAEYLDMGKVSVYVNDATNPTVFAENEVFFNRETGELTFAEIPLTVYSVKVVIDGETLASKIAGTLGSPAQADIARQVRYESDIKMIPDVYLDIDFNELRINHSEIIASDVTYNTNESMSTGDRQIVEKYFEYLCYVGNNYTNSQWAATAIANGSAQLGDFVNDTRTDFGDSTGTALSSDMLELYNYLFTLPYLTNAGTSNRNQKLPLHSVMLFQGQNAEGNFESTVAADLAARPLKQEVTIRCLSKDRKNGIEYGVFGFSVSTTDGRVAAYGIYKIPVHTPVGYIQIQKESMYPDVTDGNVAYTYEGAQFQILKGNEVIRDEATGADIFTLDATGRTDTIAVPILNPTAGETYIVREVKAPTGFKTAPDQTVVVNTGHTASSPAVAKFIEEPYVYDADIKLDKLDAYSTYSEGNASLGGIRFEVLYYAGYGKDDFGSLGGSPTRRWTIETKPMETTEQVTDNGIVREFLRTYGHTELQEEYLVSGMSDPLYKDSDGRVVMPIGTYVVRETDAGDGYRISGEMYVMQDGIKEPNFATNKQGTSNPSQGLIFMVKANIPETPDYRTEIDPTGNRLADYEVYKTTGYIGATAPNGTRVTNIIRSESVITATDTVKYGGFSVQKYDINDRTNNPQGNADDMSGRYGVKNLSDHAVTIKSENGIQINTGFASKWEVIDGIRYYTFEPVSDNNMTEYMFTFNTNYYGFFRSSNNLLPYGTYEIDELVEPEGYQKNGIVNVKFDVTEDGSVVETTGIYNMIDRGGIFLVKFDAEDGTSTNQGSGQLQGTYTIKNKSLHYVWILDNEDIEIIKENADKEAGAVEVTGEGTWYKFAPETDMFTFTTRPGEGFEAMYRSDPYLLPYGTYEIRETGTSDSYIISEIRKGGNKATFSITKTGDVIEFGTNRGQITNVDLTMRNPVARGGFKVQKNDADRKDHKDGETATSRVPQGDAAFEGAVYKVTTNNPNYVWIKDVPSITMMTENAVSSKDIDGDTWYKFENGADMFTFRVDADGAFLSESDMLPYGQYTITEVSASEGYLATETRGSIITQQISITAEGQIFDISYEKDAEDGEYDESLYEAVIRGGVRIQKNDADVYGHLSTTAQGDATFKDAVYDIYNISSSYVWVDTDNNGTYGDNEYYRPIGIDTSNPEVITYDDVKDFEPVYTITTGADGIAQTGETVLPYGRYLIVERTPSEGYLNGIMRDGIVAHTFEIREEGVITDKLTYASAEESGDLSGTFYEPIIRGGFDFQKNDEETGKNVPLGGANLKAKFSVTNVSNSYVWIKDEEGIDLKTDGEDHYYDEETGYHLYGRNEVMFTFETDAHTGKFQSSNVLLPYGTYKVTEILPPDGYLVESNRNPDMSTVFHVRNEGELADATQAIYNYVMRGNVFFEKKDAKTGIKMTYIPFLITSLDQDGQPIESHVVYTDKNGSFGSSSMYTVHSYKTNKADETVKDIDALLELILANDDDAVEKFLKDGEYYTKDSIKEFFDKENYGMGLGVWFGVGTEPIDEGRTETLNATGALPFGRYRLDELPCEANKGKALVHDMFTISNEECKTTKKNNPLRWQLGSMAAGNINFGTIYNWEKPLAPQMTTEAAVRASDTQFSGTDSTMVIVDTVHYQGIIKDKEYTLQAMVADAETGEFLRDATGDIAMVTEFFTPNRTDGYIKMEIPVNTKGYEGRTVVVYETLYDEHGDIFLNHCDPNDEKQQVHFPALTTGVVVKETNEQVSAATEKVTVIDTVSYSNLSAGIPYTIKSYLIDSETGAVVTDASGRRIESEQPFKPTMANGTFDVTFTFDASEMAGKKVIVCEEIIENGYVISSHADKDNDRQAVWFPALDTNIMDKNSCTQMALAEGRTVATDKVSYTMVKPGLTYNVKGTLVDAETGDRIADSSTTITPSGEKGTANVTFTFDSGNLAGRTVVAYAELEYESNSIAVHEDMEDTDEMIHFPDIDTEAKDGENKFKLSKADNDVTIVDTVAYENLVAGHEYIVSGYLVYADTGIVAEDAYGEGISASQSFVAENENGSIDMEFTFDGSLLAGRTVVVYESINVESGNDVPLVAVHEDLGDEDQTIRFPKITASAADRTNLEHITKPGMSVLYDTVKYSNVIPGVEYMISGKLVVKETREVLDTAEVRFTPSLTEGTTEVEYTVDTKDLAGKTLVFVEDLRYDGFSVAESNNLNDRNETIYVPSVDTKAVDGENGTQVSNADDSVTITDTVTYTNLIPGKQYVVIGKVMDQETGEVLSSYIIDEPAYDERGEMHEKWVCEGCGMEFTSRDEVLDHVDKSDSCETYIYELYYDKIHHDEVGHYGEITAVKPFVAASPDGTIIMEFNFDGTELEDKKVVVYEEIFMENEDGVVLTENYDCMQCGAHYETKAEVEEHFRTSEAGCNTYAFKYTTDMFSVGEHKEQYDDDQTIFIPKLMNPEKGKTDRNSFFSRITGTASISGIIPVAAADEVAKIPSGNHYLEAGKDSVVYDTVTYTTLRPGNTYTIVGTLVDKETGVPTDITATTTFVATQEKADVELVFEFDSAAYAGRLLVATETAYINGTDQVAKYYDLDDFGKTIYIVKVDSQITDDNTDENVTQYGKTTITDTITVSGLKPGAEYIGKGKLIDPSTGKEYKNIEASVIPVEGTDKDVPVNDIRIHDETETAQGQAVVEEKTDRNAFEFVVDAVRNFFNPKTSDEIEFTATETRAVFRIAYELDTSTMQGKSVVSYIEIVEKESNKPIGKHEDPEDEDQTLHVPELTSSKIIDAYTGIKQVMLGKTAVADEMEYGNLIVGKEYTAKAFLVDAESGDVLAESEESFTAANASGKQQITFYVDSSKIVGRTLSAVEELYLNGTRIGYHESKSETDKLHVAEITTNAISEASTSQSAPVAGRTVVTDTVSYRNLIPGETYTVTGSLVDKETEKQFKVYEVTDKKEAEGKDDISVTFVPEKPDGKVKVSFAVDTSEISGKTLVGYETITYNKFVVAEHKNPDDPAQSIMVPKISSTAKDKDTEAHIVAATPSATIIDRISVDNLVPGTKYSINAGISEGENGVVISEFTKEFTAEGKNTVIDIEIPLNALDYAGKTLFVSDSLSVNGVELVKQKNVHKLHVCAVKTSIRDKSTDIPMAEHDIDTKIIDTVEYDNIVPGLEYTVHGELVSKKTGKVLDSKDIKMKADSAKGTVEVEFEIDTTEFDGRQFVAFETIKYNGVTVGTHEDMEDEKQTMNVAQIGTEAFINGKKEVPSDKSTLLIDTVNYENLRTGYEYDLIGTVVDSKTGQVVTCNDVPVTSTVSFTPDKADGVVEVPFTFDTTSMEGRTVVVYEELKYNNVLIAQHKDINDAKQTVTITASKDDGDDKAEDAKVIVKYLDREGMPISPEVIIRGKVNDPYKAEAKEIKGYRLKETPQNAIGVMTKEDTEVLFIYDMDVSTDKNDGIVVAEYVDSNGNSISSSTITTGKIGSSYEVKAKEVEGYKLTRVPENAKGKYAKETIKVTFVYSRTGEGTTGESKVIVKYLDADGMEIAPETVVKGTVGLGYEVKAKDISGYKVETVPENAKGKFTKEDIEVLFVYKLDMEVGADEAVVIVKYVNTENKAISEATMLKGRIGMEYEAKPKSIIGYELYMTPDNAKGTYAKGVTVTFVYKAVKTEEKQDAKVIVRYVENINSTEIAEQYTITGKVGDNYTTSAKNITGYKVSTIPSNAKGIMTEKDTVVTYLYEKTSSVTKSPTLTLKKTPSSSIMTIGTPLKYTITVSATGADAKNVVITETINEKAVVSNGVTTLKVPNVSFNRDSIKITGKDGNPVSAKDIQIGNNGVMTITLDSVKASDVITITYTMVTNDTSLNGQWITMTTNVKADNSTSKAASLKVQVKSASNTVGNTTTNQTVNNGGSTNTTGNKYTYTNNGTTTGTVNNSGSGSTTDKSNIVDGVKTGDSYAVAVVIAVIAVAAGVLGFVLLRKRR